MCKFSSDDSYSHTIYTSTLLYLSTFIITRTYDLFVKF